MNWSAEKESQLASTVKTKKVVADMHLVSRRHFCSKIVGFQLGGCVLKENVQNPLRVHMPTHIQKMSLNL
jgi:hypothetical protein